MIATRCQECGVIIRVAGILRDLLLLDDPKWSVNFPCVMPKCNGRAERIPYELTLVHECRDLPVETYYKALQGFGLPGGKAASVPGVYGLLTGRRVVNADLVAASQPDRCVVNSLTLEDGTVLHFAAGSKGACVYYIEEPPDERSHLDTCTDPENGAEDRSKAGQPSPPREGPSSPNQPHELHGDGMSAMPEASGVSPGDYGERMADQRSGVRVRARPKRASDQ